MLNQEEIKEDPQRIIKSKPFIDKYNWEGISYPSEKDEWKKFEKSNLTIALVVLYAKKIYPAYVSKHNSNGKKQFIFLMIPNGQRWHYLPVKRL